MLILRMVVIVVPLLFTALPAQAVAGDCSPSLHEAHVTQGQDGLVYATWHASTHPSGCSYGHEHGDNPSGSPAISGRSVTFGLAGVKAGLSEPHAGFKVFRWDNVRHVNAPQHDGASVVMTVHQGTSGAARFTTVHHSVQFDYINPRDGREVHISMMAPFGRLIVLCGDSRLATTSSVAGNRQVSGPQCFSSPGRVYEDWVTALYVGSEPGGTTWRAYVDPHFAVFRPATYCQPQRAPGTADGWSCILGQSDTKANTGQDPFSSSAQYKGVKREGYLNQVWTRNAGQPSTFWTDPYGRMSSPGSTGAIAQYVCALDYQQQAGSSAFGRGHNNDPSGTVRQPN